MTGSPPHPSGSIQQITVLGIDDPEAGGILSFILGAKLRCSDCGRVSSRWDIPADDQTRPNGLGAHEPGA